MLYIFHVETGTMMTFDMNFAIESVVSLKTMIEKVCKIPANKQVLLVSGGEVLRPDARVCSYSAGTDTNPIYMFSKTIIESGDPPKSHCDYGTETGLKEQVDRGLIMPPGYNTVLACAQLAQQFWDVAREHVHACEKLVHEQHLQQQGWAAVVANMEDVTSDFQERAQDFEDKYKDQVSKRKEHVEFLSRFNEDLEVLSSIPILPALRLNAASNPFTAFDGLHGESESYDDDNSIIKEDEENKNSESNNSKNSDIQKVSNDDSSSSKGVGGSSTSEGDEGLEISKDGQKLRKQNQLVRMKSKQGNKEALTLLHWITVKENQESLKHIAEYCKTAMDMFDSNVMTILRQEVVEALESAKKDNIKRIKGLEERLSGLEQLMCEARRLEQEQRDLANAFQNRQSAADMDVLKLLCESYKKQLQNMLKNHQQLSDIRRRCAKAKEELAINLYHRLRWIVYVENRMFEIDSKLMFYHRSLARLKRHLAVIGQLHRAPRLFCTAVHEIVRRRTFSQAFLTWASELASHLLTIHNEENMRRKNFNALFAGHFLGGLFPGTEDMPPNFATQTPKLFDNELPRLTQADIDTLSTRLPHLTPEIPPCDMQPVITFFRSRSGSQESKQFEDKATNVTKDIDRGFESETDTEEFEKVGQSPIDRGGGAVQLPAAPLRTDATTLTEVRTHTRQPPVKPPRARPPTPLPLTPIPEAASPHPECGCLLSPTLSSPAAMSPRPPSPSSPTAAPGHRADFEPAEFYIEESPPVSLEWGCSASPLDSQTLVSLLQENLGTISSKQNETECLKDMLSLVMAKCNDSIKILKSDMERIKSDVNDHHLIIKDDCFKVASAWEKYATENALRERETFQRLTVDHELELNDIKHVLNKKDEEISLLKAELVTQKENLQKLFDEKNLEISSLQEKIKQFENLKLEHAKTMEEAEVARQKAIKELQDKMAQEYKAEVESLRSRFRLVAVTSMDRSPSESSLERIERTDMIEISNHKAILLQTKADLEQEKEDAVKAACEMKDQEWGKKLTVEMQEYKNKCESEKRSLVKDAVKRIIDEKDRQLDQSRDRESYLYRECVKYKETIQQLTDPETSCFSGPKPFYLDAATSTDFKICKKMPKSHTPLGIPSHYLSVSSCEPGNVVFVLWDGMHCNYTVLQESPLLYLLHPDCLPALDLKLNVKDESERKLYAIARVESKEFCNAVRSGNKYQVGVSQRFYRVKVGPIKSLENISKYYCCDNSSSSSKDHESSQSKNISRMSVSEMVQLSESSSKSRGECSMSRSAHHYQSSSSTKDKSSDAARSSHEKSKISTSESSPKMSQIKVDDGTETLASISEEKTEDQTSTRLLSLSGSACIHADVIVNVQTTECVPYTESELVSEIAEEAAP